MPYIFLSFLGGVTCKHVVMMVKSGNMNLNIEGKRYRRKGFRTKREADSAGLDKLNELRLGL